MLLIEMREVLSMLLNSWFNNQVNLLILLRIMNNKNKLVIKEVIVNYKVIKV